MKKNSPMRNNVYVGKVLKCIDGDSLEVSINLGWNVTQVFRIRIDSVDTKEIHGTEKKKGLEAKEKLKKLIENKEILLKQAKDNDKYGRLLAEVYFNDMLISDWLIQEGLGKEYHGEKKVKFCTLSIENQEMPQTP